MTRRPKPRRSLLWESEEGFTLVEVLVALTLLATISLVVWGASFTGGCTLSRISTGISHNIELLEIDSTIRSYAQRIVIPYWLASPKGETSNGSLTVPYLDGVKERCLQLSVHNDALTMTDGDQTVTFADVQDARSEVSPPAQGATPALLLTLQLKGSRNVTIVAPLGGLPFPPLGGQ